MTDSNLNKIESFNWQSPYKKSVISTEIDQNDKIIAAENHRKQLELLQQNHSENIIIYSDGSKQNFYAEAGAFISYSIDNQQQYS